MAVRETLLDPLVDKNPVMLQVLGICSALAITSALDTALVMGVSLTAVLVFSNTAISLIRNLIPPSLRIIIQMTIIATGVIVVDQVLQAFLPDVARTLSVFVGLIVTNCIVLGRAEAFAVKNGVAMSVLDGLGNGLGYTLVLVVVGAIRELFGAGTLLKVLRCSQPSLVLKLPQAAGIDEGLQLLPELTLCRPHHLERAKQANSARQLGRIILVPHAVVNGHTFRILLKREGPHVAQDEGQFLLVVGTATRLACTLHEHDTHVRRRLGGQRPDLVAELVVGNVKPAPAAVF